MAGYVHKYEWGGELLTAPQIAKREGIPYRTLSEWLLRSDRDIDKVADLYDAYKANKLKKETVSKRRFVKEYKYKDGRILTITEILKLEPHMNRSLLQSRYRQCDTDDWECIFGKKGRQLHGHKHKMDDSALSGMGPRRPIESIKHPTEYEKKLWGDHYDK